MIAYLITLVASGIGFLLLVTSKGTSLMVFLVGLTILLVVFKVIGSVQILKTLSDIRLRSSIAHAQRIERKGYEQSHLEFRTVETFEQWWECMCKAAEALNFARVSMELVSHDGPVETRQWENAADVTNDETMENILQMRVPIKDLNNGFVHKIEIQVRTNGSVESAGRRVALFARLTDEHRLDSRIKVKGACQLMGSEKNVCSNEVCEN
jgi:hypothetical protein